MLMLSVSISFVHSFGLFLFLFMVQNASEHFDRYVHIVTKCVLNVSLISSIQWILREHYGDVLQRATPTEVEVDAQL